MLGAVVVVLCSLIDVGYDCSTVKSKMHSLIDCDITVDFDCSTMKSQFRLD